MYLPKEMSQIDDTRLIGHWHGNTIPVYDVTSIHGLNQIIGYVKHTNANNGTVLYRGQAHLHEKLIPSILHGNPSPAEIVDRSKKLQDTINSIVTDEKMQTLLHFDDSTVERSFYKQHVTESMLQHYGFRTRFQDFVDNHWTALWFGLHELQKEPMKDCVGTDPYYNYYYTKRKKVLPSKEKAPVSMHLKEPETKNLPNKPELIEIPNEKDYTPEMLSINKNLQMVLQISDEVTRTQALSRMIARDIGKRQMENQSRLDKWERDKLVTTIRNQRILEQYNIDQESDIAYVYLLLYVADTRGENFKGVYTGTETVTIDLRKALPSVLLRPCAQHGWTVRRLGDESDLSSGVVCVLRLTVSLVDEMMGDGSLVSYENFFPPVTNDSGYRILLSREQPAPFGSPSPKYPKDLPSLFPFATFQHYIQPEA